MTTQRRKKPRPGKWISLKLFFDEDETLIRWLESLPQGKRAATLRDVLRSHVDEQDLVALLTAQHRETQRKLDHLAARFDQGVPIALGASAAAPIDDAAAQRRKHNLLKTEW
jgi:hypothetical protein